MSLPFAAQIAAAAKAQPSVPNALVVPGRVLRVDGDYAAYACAGGPDTTPSQARRKYLDRIDNALFYSGAEQVVVHLSHRATSKGHRGLCATVKPYQGHRSGSSKPRNWGFMRDFLESLPNAAITSHREADDALAEAATADPKNTVTYSADKDMRMFPGFHLTWKDHRLTYIEPGTFDFVLDGVDEDGDALQYGHKWFWLQMLHGDGADNIPGLEKLLQSDGKFVDVGKTRAGIYLADTRCNTDAQRRVCDAYEAYYGDAWADRFVEQASLLWMRTTSAAPVYDFFLYDGLLDTDTRAKRYKQIFAATMRLKQRVEGAKREINRVTDQAVPGTVFEYAEW